MRKGEDMVFGRRLQPEPRKPIPRDRSQGRPSRSLDALVELGWSVWKPHAYEWATLASVSNVVCPIDL
eukprot:gene15965-biopygen13552